MRLTIDKQSEYARELLASLEKELGKEFIDASAECKSIRRSWD
jgi:hypothetical protein